MEFEWDSGNSSKNLKKHQVSDQETEEVFSDSHKVQKPDPFHSGREIRFILIGKTRGNRLLFTVYTIRRQKIRIISSRDKKKKERSLYEKAT
ncbi:BrnT family toxin [Candidatus Amesbacteria bacterium]|nr:BrnT family toxin [Candidatus Amesbacteria bacterium]